MWYLFSDSVQYLFPVTDCDASRAVANQLKNAPGRKDDGGLNNQNQSQALDMLYVRMYGWFYSCIYVLATVIE